MRQNRIRAASMRSACCVCFNACRVANDFCLRSAKALIAAFGSALKRMANLSFSDMGRAVCYHSRMWDILQLLWYMFLFVFGMVIVPTWIFAKIVGLFFPSDD